MMTGIQKIENLRWKCLEIRRDIIEMIHTAGSGHPGGSLSAVEILTALYFHTMNISPENPQWQNRDRFILSKGHAAPAVYAVLAERGFFPKEELLTFSASGTRLQKHIDMTLVPGTELSTGSLAQGLSVGVGMALADKMDKKERYVYVLIGDGESQEGQIWEASMAAAQFKLNKLVVFLDNNGCQVDGYVRDICSLDPIEDKWRSFGWHVQSVNGHNLNQIITALENVQRSEKPNMIVAKTVKGKDISFMENRPEWHAQALNEEQYQIALADLSGVELALRKGKEQE